MSSVVKPIESAFDENHDTATPSRKLVRSPRPGPKYHLWDLPRYSDFRRSLGLSPRDGATLRHPFREFSQRIHHALDLPPGYETAPAEYRPERPRPLAASSAFVRVQS